MKPSALFLYSFLATFLLADGEQLAFNDRIYTLEELQNITIVSATGTEKKISEAPSVATVITAEQIQRSSARTLAEVLEMVPGLNVYLSPVDVQKKSYDIRGIRTSFNSQILTLVNGTPLDRVFTGSSIQRFEFPASAIKRVEIIRGPGSAIYGADAFSGVINIITKDAKYLLENSQAGVRYGSFNRAEIYGNYGEVFESGLEMGLNLSYMTSKGDRNRIITSDLQTVFDGIFATSASLSPGAYDDRYKVYNMNLNLKYNNFSMNFWVNLSKNAGLGAGVANTLDPRGFSEGKQSIIDLKYDLNPSDAIKWSNKVTLSYIDVPIQFNIFPSGTKLPIGADGNLNFSKVAGVVTFTNGYLGNPETKESKVAYESTFNISKFQDQEIRVSFGYSYVKFETKESKNFGPGVIDATVSPIGATLTNVTGTSYVFQPTNDRKIFYLSLQDEYNFANKWHLTAGVRYDNYSDFGDTINPRVGLVWNTSSEFTTKLLYGRAFRAPNFAELYNQNNPINLGNKNLKPETIDMLEFGAKYTPSLKLMSSFNIYYYDMDNIIKALPSSIGVQSQNSGKQQGAGIELEVSYQLSENILCSSDYAYRWTQDAKDKAVANVPKHLFHAMVDYSLTSRIFVNSELFYTADTPRAQNDARAKIKDYALLNLSSGYRLSAGFKAIVAIRNLLDEKYVNPSNANPVNDYPMEGRSIYAELKYRF